MDEVCKAVHKQRSILEDGIADGEIHTLVAAHPKHKQIVAASVLRRHERFYCRDFESFDVSETGISAVFARRAA